MSIRERTWETSPGQKRTAYLVDYRDQHGKRRAKQFSRLKEAKEFQSKTHVEVLGKVHVADSETVTVAEAGKLWLATCDAAGLERTTRDQYSQHLKLHIEPFIGTKKLTEITIPSIRAFMDKLRVEGRSDAMLRNVRVSLGAILSDAQERGLVVRNVVKEMGRSRSKITAARHKEQVQVGVDLPTPEEVKLILKHAEGQARTFLMTAVFTGMRASELRGVTWADVDLKRGEMTVRRRADAHNKIGSPKSAKGRRTIPLISSLVKALQAWQTECPTGDLNLVFPNGSGNVEWHANIIDRLYQPAQVAASVTTKGIGPDGKPVRVAKYTGLHALRHFYASWCINRPEDGGLGLPAKLVQERMGHSSITVTMDTYGHLFPKGDDTSSMDLAAAAILE